MIEKVMRGFFRIVDSISEWSGKTVRWLCVAVILVMTFEVIMRHVFDSPQLWAYEVPIMLGAAMYALSWSYVHRHNAHTRIDVFYQHLSPRGRAIVDVLGNLIFFFPLLLIITNNSFYFTLRAWKIHETMFESHWYPPIYPLRTVVTIGLCLFILQGIVQFIRHAYLLVRNQQYD